MSSTGLHICLETDGAPSREGDFEIGTRWVCSCGTNFVWREGFNRGGFLTPGWWEAPAIPQQRTSLSVRLFGPRKG